MGPWRDGREGGLSPAGPADRRTVRGYRPASPWPPWNALGPVGTGEHRGTPGRFHRDGASLRAIGREGDGRRGPRLPPYRPAGDGRYTEDERRDRSVREVGRGAATARQPVDPADVPGREGVAGRAVRRRGAAGLPGSGPRAEGKPAG